MEIQKNGFVKKIKSFVLKNDSDYFWRLRTKALNANNKLLKLYYRYRYAKLMKSMGSAIPLEAIIEGKPELPHGIYGIFVSRGAKIGKGCIIYQQVTIGSNADKDSKGYGFPAVGDHVLIGVGAKIIGNVKIGNRVKIGANAVVTKDLPDNCTAIMGGGLRIIEKD